MRENFNYFSYFLLILIIGYLTYENFKLNKKIDEEVFILNETKKKENVNKTIFYDQVITSLKKTNKELYDSVKTYKENIDYLLQFKYEKNYKIDTVYIDTTTVKNNEIKTFEYFSDKNDTLNYNLKIGSLNEPSWYSLDFKVSDTFTIMNRNKDGINETTIKSENNGKVSDVTVLKRRKHRQFLRKFAVGPSLTVGYDLAKKEPEVMLGIAVTYDLF